MCWSENIILWSITCIINLHRAKNVFNMHEHIWVFFTYTACIKNKKVSATIGLSPWLSNAPSDYRLHNLSAHLHIKICTSTLQFPDLSPDNYVNIWQILLITLGKARLRVMSQSRRDYNIPSPDGQSYLSSQHGPLLVPSYMPDKECPWIKDEQHTTS